MLDAKIVGIGWASAPPAISKISQILFLCRSPASQTKTPRGKQSLAMRRFCLTITERDNKWRRWSVTLHYHGNGDMNSAGGSGMAPLWKKSRRFHVAIMVIRGQGSLSIFATFFRRRFAVHRLAVSNLVLRHLPRFRFVGGGCYWNRSLNRTKNDLQQLHRRSF